MTENTANDSGCFQCAGWGYFPIRGSAGTIKGFQWCWCPRGLARAALDAARDATDAVVAEVNRALWPLSLDLMASPMAALPGLPIGAGVGVADFGGL